MFRLGTHTRIALILSSIVTSVILCAIFFGFVPDEQKIVDRERIAFSEAQSLNAKLFITEKNLEGLAAVLDAVVQRNEQVESIGYRDAESKLILSSGPHADLWTLETDQPGTSVQMHVPLGVNAEHAGQIEFCYTPIRHPGLLGLWDDRRTHMLLAIGFACFLAFAFVLRKILKQLDTGGAVPTRVRSALDTLTEGLLLLNHNAKIVMANSAFSELVGIPAEKLVGKKAEQFDWRDDEQGGRTPKSYPWVRALVQKRPQPNILMHLEVQPGDRRTFIVNCSPVLGTDGTYRGVLASFDDVTQLEQKKAELKIAMELAEDANRSKSDFLANMSHEIRTPMNAILGFTEVLRRGYAESPEQAMNYLNTIQVSGAHLLELINDILDLSKVEAGQMQMEQTECQPHRVLLDVVTLLKVKADENGISLS